MERIVLIAAHDLWFIQLLRAYSEECGCRVVEVYQAQDVMVTACERNPSVILFQEGLPGQQTEVDLLRSLHENPLTSHIPVMVFSGQLRQVQNCTMAAAYLEESVTYDTFVDALQKAGVRS